MVTWFGTGIHESLAQWYRPGFERGPHPADVFDEWCNDEVRTIKAASEEWHDEPLYVDAQNLGISMLEEYVNTYGDDPDIEMLATEQPFEIDIVADDEVVAIFRGIFDGVFRDHSDGRIYLIEHKTAAQIALQFLELDDQAGSYFAVATIVLQAAGILGPDEHISGIMYNYLRKTAPDDRERNEQGAYLNKDGSVSKRQPARAFVREIVERTPREVENQIRRLAAEAAAMEDIRSGRLDPVKNTSKDCPYCPFWEMCVLDERGNKRALKEYKRLAYTERDGHWEKIMKSASE